MVVLSIVNMLLLMVSFLAALIKPGKATGTAQPPSRREGQHRMTERTVNNVAAVPRTVMPTPGREFIYTQLSQTTQKG